MKWANVLRPVGPLAAAVYWRRRSGVILVVIVAVLLVSRACDSSGSSPSARPVVTPSAAGRSSPAPATTAPRSASPAPAVTVPLTGALTSITRVGYAAAAVPRCPAAQLQVRIDADATAYSSLTAPLLTMRVSADNTVPCALDLAPALTSVRITLSGVTVWSGADCSTRPARRILIRPGGTTSLAVRWNHTARSSPCGRAGPLVGPGLYEVLGTANGVTAYGGTLTLR